MSSKSPRSSNRRASKQQDSDDSYANMREPKQSHAGYLLAFVSVLAVLGFGIWTAMGTVMGSGDDAGAKALATVAPTRPATVTAVAAPAPTAASTAPAASATRPVTGTPGGSKVHVVGEGDTLYRIAQRYSTTVEAIMEANGFTDRSKILHIGDRLTIP